MKEVCGFKDLENTFHTSKESCEISDLKIKIRDTKRTLDNFYSEITEYLWMNSNRYDEGSREDYFKKEVLDLVSYYILRDSDKFLDIIKKKKDLKKTLDRLQTEELKKKFNFTWWLKTKWW